MYDTCVDESGASVGVDSAPGIGSALGDARRLAPGLADGGVSDALLPAPLPLPRRASWRARLRITSDFMEMGRAEPCSL